MLTLLRRAPPIDPILFRTATGAAISSHSLTGPARRNAHPTCPVSTSYCHSKRGKTAVLGSFRYVIPMKVPTRSTTDPGVDAPINTRSFKVSNPKRSTDLATAAWITFLILVPIIILAIIISPFILHYCDPRRTALTKDDLRKIRATQDERDERWALPPELAGPSQMPQGEGTSSAAPEETQEVGETEL